MMRARGRESKFFKSIILISTMVLLGACGKQNLPSDYSSVFQSQIIIGDLDWKEITGLSSSNQIRINGKAVGDVDLPVMGSRCTGFLISEDVFMTNHHCIPSSRYASGVTVKFKHEKGVSTANQAKYNCSTFIGNNRELDFALLKCAGKPGRKFGFVKLDSDAKSKNTSIYIVQQNCDYYTSSDCDWTKKYSEGNITKVAAEYSHNADTLGGSSGSPVFSKSNHEVVAIHHAGAGNNGRGRGYENFAVPMSKIVPYILTHFPQVDLGGSSDDGSDDGDDDQSAQDYEPNNSLSSSAYVGLPFEANLKVGSSSDNDYFKFKTTSAGKIKVKVTFSHSEGDLDLKLINGSRKTIAKSESTSSQESIEYDAPKGTFYVKVFGYKGAKAKYKIQISVNGQAVGNEPNDSVATATSVSLPTELDKKIDTAGDLDYYEFKLTHGKTVDVSLSFDHSVGDLDLFLINESEDVLDKSTSVKSFEKMTKYLPKGTYYVVVKGYKSAKGSYKVKLK